VKLVCLEIVIVSIATRAILALIGKPPPLPDIAWACVTVLAVLVAAVLLAAEAIASLRGRRVVYPPHIPLERIGPYRHERIAARAGRGRHVNLN